MLVFVSIMWPRTSEKDGRGPVTSFVRYVGYMVSRGGKGPESRGEYLGICLCNCWSGRRSKELRRGPRTDSSLERPKRRAIRSSQVTKSNCSAVVYLCR